MQFITLGRKPLLCFFLGEKSYTVFFCLTISHCLLYGWDSTTLDINPINCTHFMPSSWAVLFNGALLPLADCLKYSSLIIISQSASLSIWSLTSNWKGCKRLKRMRRCCAITNNSWLSRPADINGKKVCCIFLIYYLCAVVKFVLCVFFVYWIVHLKLMISIVFCVQYYKSV